MVEKKKHTVIQTPVFRAAFVHLATPSEYKGKKTYQVDAIWTPSKMGQLDRAAYQNMAALESTVFTDRFGKNINEVSDFHYYKTGSAPLYWRVFRCGENPKKAKYSGYGPGTVWATLKTAYIDKKTGAVRPPPEVVDMNGRKIADLNQIYAGCYMRASCIIVPFPIQGTDSNQGVTILLNNLQKVADGERLDGGVSAEREFANCQVDQNWLENEIPL